MKIGCIIPFYKGGEFIADAVNSCLWQSYKDIHIIVVNDSPEESIGEWGSYGAVYCLEHQKNLGQNAAKNTAIMYARRIGCTHIFSLDQDNVLPPKLIEQLVENMGDNHAISPGKLVFFAHPGKPEDSIQPDTFNPPSNNSWDFEYDECDFPRMVTDFKVPPSGGQYLYSVEAWEAAGGYPPQDEDWHGDWGFGFRHVAKGYPIKILSGTHYWHRTHSDSMAVSNNSDMLNWRKNHVTDILIRYSHLLDKRSSGLVKSGKYTGYDLINEKRLRCR